MIYLAGFFVDYLIPVKFLDILLHSGGMIYLMIYHPSLVQGVYDFMLCNDICVAYIIVSVTVCLCCTYSFCTCVLSLLL